MPKGFDKLREEDQVRIQEAVSSRRVSDEDRLAVREKKLMEMDGDLIKEEVEAGEGCLYDMAIALGMEGEEGEEEGEEHVGDGAPGDYNETTGRGRRE